MNKNFQRLLEAVADEEASEDQVNELNEILINDREARDIYRAYCSIHIELQNRAASKPQEMVKSDNRLKKFYKTALIAASITIAAALLILKFNEASQSPLGYIVSTNNKENVSIPVFAGEQTFSKGFSRVEMTQGVILSLEGPASIKIINDKHILLNEGKLTAFVPERATGFAVSTNDTRIVDLGTEFGVEIGDNGSEVHVFQGAVKLEEENKNDKKILTAGQVRSKDGSTGLLLASDVQFEKSRDALTGGAIKDYFIQSELSQTSNNGWTSGWQLHERYGTPTKAMVVSDFPLMNDSGNYLSVSSLPNSPNKEVRPVIRRQYQSTEYVDLSKPHTVEFLFRLDVPAQEVGKILIFDAPEERVWPSSKYTWSMSAGRVNDDSPLQWEIWNPFENSEKYARLELKQSVVYKIVIFVEPSKSRQMVTISNGKKTIANSMDDGTAVKFRNGAKSIGGFLHFVVAVKNGTTGAYSIDNLRIRNTPQAFLDRKVQLKHQEE